MENELLHEFQQQTIGNLWLWVIGSLLIPWAGFSFIFREEDGYIGGEFGSFIISILALFVTFASIVALFHHSILWGILAVTVFGVDIVLLIRYIVDKFRSL